MYADNNLLYLKKKKKKYNLLHWYGSICKHLGYTGDTRYVQRFRRFNWHISLYLTLSDVLCYKKPHPGYFHMQYYMYYYSTIIHYILCNPEFHFWLIIIFWLSTELSANVVSTEQITWPTRPWYCSAALPFSVWPLLRKCICFLSVHSSLFKCQLHYFDLLEKCSVDRSTHAFYNIGIM